MDLPDERAQELGFRDLAHLEAVLSGDETTDVGTLLSPPGADVFWNVWSADHGEAAKIRRQTDGWLLAYKRQFFVVERGYIEFLGLDPDDPDWDLIGRDWARPGDFAARERLYRKLFTHRLSPRDSRSGRATWV